MKTQLTLAFKLSFKLLHTMFMIAFVIVTICTVTGCQNSAQKLTPSKSFIETTDATRLFYRDWGNGQPVVFLAGWGLSGEIWEYQVPFLIEHGLRCVTYDRRGHGRSDQPGYGYDYDTLADDLAAVIDNLGLKNVVLIAHSMGSGEIARYLTRHGSKQISRVILIAPVTPFLLRTEDNPHGVPQEAFDAGIVQMRNDRPRYLAVNSPAFFGAGQRGSPVSYELIQWGIQMALETSPVAVIETYRTLTQTDLRPDMNSFTLPTLIIHGDADQSAPLELTGRKTADAISGSELIVYQGAPHGLLITHHQRISEDIVKFIRR